MRFKPDYKLESGYTYYVTAKIKPTTKAYLKYQNQSYTDTGDENTDEYLGTDKKPGNDTKNIGTSSKQKGFYSNVSANVTYKYNNETYTKPYAKPVIQVNASTVSHTVVKQWENGSDKVAVDVELKAYVTEAADSKINADNPKYLTSADVKNLPTSMQVSLSETNNWTYTWENLPTKYFYETTGGIKETDIHYTVEEVQTDATKAFYGQVTESSDGKTTTILNKKKDQEDKPFIEVTKTFKGLTKTQIRELANPENPYTITLIHTDTNTSKTLTMNAGELNDILQGNDNEKVWTYTWKLEDCLDGTYKVIESNYGKDGYDVNNAGVYAVKATTTDTANYAYSPMAAYISFGTYTTAPTDLAPATVNAKKTTIKIEKNSNENDGVVEIGKEVTYTVKTNIPYIADNVTDVTYTITDTIDGANYKTNAAGNVEVSVKIGAANPTTSTVTPSTTQDGKKQIVIDLSNVAANRTNANAEVVITYKAIVTSEIVNNTVVPNDGTHHFTPVTNTLYTGKITITKTDDSEKNPVKLANAGFVIYRTTKENKPLYALVSKDTSKNNNEYVVTGWTETLNDAKADTNLIMTDSNGEAVVRGLDDSYAYNFKEIKAPEGYSVNTTDSSATWGNNQEASNRTGTASMTDTKLSALPETGGIGTTIFTIAGCVIMIAAAGLFFASRKKTNK